MIILDTNIVSESLRVRPSDVVQRWLDDQNPTDLYLCTPVLAEMRYGVEKLPAGRRRTILEDAIRASEQNIFGGRVLAFDRESAIEFGHLVAKRERLGHTIKPMDALIAAIALANGMAVATRDVDDFSELGLDVINPFDYGPAAPRGAP